MSVAWYFISYWPHLRALAIQLDLSLPFSRTLSCTHTLSLQRPILTALPLFVYSREERPEVSGSELGPREQRLSLPFKNPPCCHRLESTTPDTIARDQPFHDLGARGDRPDNKCHRRDHKCGHRYSCAWKARISGSEENPQHVEARQSAIEDFR